MVQLPSGGTHNLTKGPRYRPQLNFNCVPNYGSRYVINLLTMWEPTMGEERKRKHHESLVLSHHLLLFVPTALLRRRGLMAPVPLSPPTSIGPQNSLPGSGHVPIWAGRFLGKVGVFVHQLELVIFFSDRSSRP